MSVRSVDLAGNWSDVHRDAHRRRHRATGGSRAGRCHRRGRRGRDHAHRHRQRRAGPADLRRGRRARARHAERHRARRRVPPARTTTGPTRSRSSPATADDSAPATVTITVRPVNDPPTATPRRHGPVRGSVAVPLAGTDVDGDPLTFVVVTQPSHGALTGTPPALTYTSAAGYAGSRLLRLRDVRRPRLSAPATVTIDVTRAATGPRARGRRQPRRPRTSGRSRAPSSGPARACTSSSTRPNGVRSVTFRLDGRSSRVDSAAPFDFAGTSELSLPHLPAGATRSSPTCSRPAATESVADVERSDGSRTTCSASFTVAARRRTGCSSRRRRPARRPSRSTTRRCAVGATCSSDRPTIRSPGCGSRVPPRRPHQHPAGRRTTPSGRVERHRPPARHRRMRPGPAHHLGHRGPARRRTIRYAAASESVDQQPGDVGPRGSRAAPARRRPPRIAARRPRRTVMSACS